MKPLARFLTFLLLFLSGRSVSAGEVDPQFEGIWTGVETIHIPAQYTQLGGPTFTRPVVIAIGDSGRIMAVARGIGYGRYKVDAMRSGRHVLCFGVPNGTGTPWGQVSEPQRSGGFLRLSPDGNSLTENGAGFIPGYPRKVNCDITATLHRQGKK
jgi:hypothetical protein